MDKGVLTFQESIESLHSRFREVHVTLSAQKELPNNYPDSWLTPEISGHALRLIESKFENHDAMYQKLTEAFGAVQFDAEPMSLREISKVLIKDARKAGMENAA
jgi:hypothetical protein